MQMSPPISEERVKNMIHEAFSEYESVIGRVRHNENTMNFKNVFSRLDSMAGGFTTAKVIGTFIAVLLTITITMLGIMLSHRHDTSMLSTDHFTYAER
jgi:hypothetical protein